MNNNQKLKELYLDDVIRLSYEKNYSCRQISRIVPVSRTTVNSWIRKFAAEHNLSYSRMRSKPQLKQSSIERDHISRDEKSEQISGTIKLSVSSQKELLERIKQLEKQLKEAEINASAYNEMINIAESTFKIPIRKKSGAKQ